MNRAVKITLQVLFLVLVIWILAAVLGYLPGGSFTAPGVRVRIGKRKHNCRNGGGGWRNRSFVRTVTGMTGGDLVSTPGTDVPMVGVPRVNF